LGALLLILYRFVQAYILGALVGRQGLRLVQSLVDGLHIKRVLGQDHQQGTVPAVVALWLLVAHAQGIECLAGVGHVRVVHLLVRFAAPRQLIRLRPLAIEGPRLLLGNAAEQGALGGPGGLGHAVQFVAIACKEISNLEPFPGVESQLELTLDVVAGVQDDQVLLIEMPRGLRLEIAAHHLLLL